MTRLKKSGTSKDRYWVFPAVEDKHKLHKSSILLDLLPQIDVNMTMSSNRLIVMELLNSEIIAKKAELLWLKGLRGQGGGSPTY